MRGFGLLHGGYVERAPVLLGKAAQRTFGRGHHVSKSFWQNKKYQTLGEVKIKGFFALEFRRRVREVVGIAVSDTDIA